MKRIVFKFLTLTVVISTLLAMSACGKLDVVADESTKSFDRLLDVANSLVSKDDMNGGWTLAAPDGEANFIWSWDYSASPQHDVMLAFNAEPFVAAGLDPAKLPQDITFMDVMDTGMGNSQSIMVGTKLGKEKFDGRATPAVAYKQIIKEHRSSVGYHSALDHYGVNLGDGNLFEWAKDIDTNDKDIVFVLEPAPFIAAGVNPNKVKGWVFAKVIVDDANGKPVEVDKLLKPFNLK
ncbi:hypothetical protein RsTz2092_01650 [Deferribacterales bacterium RsTz2092]|nr:hypothetical protein AGMMS49941_00100 [Deferribacterales bacterium]